MIRNADIARSLVSKYGLAEKDAEAFVATMFTVLGNALRDERQAKVKGLGTFKVTSVESRESVDVNTGRRITIDSRDKISFTPDASLRDRVNSPFSQFDTFVVADGVDFSEIDRRYAESDAGVRSEDNPLPEEGEEQPREAPLTSVDKTEAANPENSPIEKPVEAIECEDNTPPLGESEGANVQNNNSENIMYDEDYLRKNAVQINSQLDKLNEQLSANIERNNLVIKLLAAFICLLIAALVAGIFYFNRQLTLRDNYIHQLEMLTTADSIQSTPVETAPAVEAEKAEPAAEQPAAEEPGPKEEAQAEPKAEVQAEPAAKPTADAPKVESKYDSDPRVRLGAYDIVGVETTVTVAAGQTLKGISKAYLGPDMECYVEALNGVKEVKPGDKLKIPKVQLKKKKK